MESLSKNGSNHAIESVVCTFEAKWAAGWLIAQCNRATFPVGTAQIARSSRDTARRPTCTNNQSCPVV
jgi:hypothetical protein